MIAKKRQNILSNFVRRKRKRLKLTQFDLSQKAGVGIRFIRELESGKETLKMDKINQVLALFGHVLGPIQANRDIDNNEKSKNIHV
jgi:y4mF family transcriptional regulator